MADPTASMDVPAPQPESARGKPPSARLNGKGAQRELERELGSVDGKKWIRRLGVVLSIFATIGLIALWRVKSQPKPPPKYVLGQVTKGEVAETVQSTGQVQPLTQVQVGAQVSGRITKVFVDFNSQVKSGDVLAEIDPSLYGAAIDQNRAALDSAVASVAHADAALATAKQRLERAKKLVAEGIGSAADLEAAQGAYDVAVADVAASKANVSQLQAALRSSRTNMEYTRIYSPIDGVVVTRSIDPGQTVAASFQGRATLRA